MDSRSGSSSIALLWYTSLSGRSEAQRAGWLLSKSTLAAALRITGIEVHYTISLGECDRISLGLFILNELAYFTLEGN